MKDLIKLSLLGVLVVALLIPMTAHGLVLTYEFNFECSGGDQPVGPTPWVTATFNDESADIDVGEVLLTISAVGLTGQEIITEVDFNFDPFHNPDLLTFTPHDISDSMPNKILTGANDCKAAAAGYFDFCIDLPPPTKDRDQYFTAGEKIAYILGYDSLDYEINAGSFNFESIGRGKNDGYYAAAHIQRIGPSGGGSGWITPPHTPPHCIPEPATVLLLGSLLIGIGVLKRKS